MLLLIVANSWGEADQDLEGGNPQYGGGPVTSVGSGRWRLPFEFPALDIHPGGGFEKSIVATSIVST